MLGVMSPPTNVVNFNTSLNGPAVPPAVPLSAVTPDSPSDRYVSITLPAPIEPTMGYAGLGPAKDASAQSRAIKSRNVSVIANERLALRVKFAFPFVRKLAATMSPFPPDKPKLALAELEFVSVMSKEKL